VFRFGVERGKDVCILSGPAGLVFLHDFHDQVGDDAGAFGLRADLGTRGEVA
jgi:hypothetical protein